MIYSAGINQALVLLQHFTTFSFLTSVPLILLLLTHPPTTPHTTQVVPAREDVHAQPRETAVVMQNAPVEAAERLQDASWMSMSLLFSAR